MNKFVSFEMIFANGESFMGNMCINHSNIECEFDVLNVETLIRQKLNAGALGTIEQVDAVTLVNWKTL